MSLKMSQEERENFLAGLHVGVVSIGRGRDAPLTVPIWYDYTPGGKIWMITGESSLKAKALANTRQISLCAQSETPPYQYATVTGTWERRDVAEGELLAMAIRYLGEEQGKAYAAGSSEEGQLIVEFTPETWLTVDYSKM